MNEVPRVDLCVCVLFKFFIFIFSPQLEGLLDEKLTEQEIVAELDKNFCKKLGGKVCQTFLDMSLTAFSCDFFEGRFIVR